MSDEETRRKERLNRRSFMSRVAGAAVIAGGAAAAVTGQAQRPELYWPHRQRHRQRR